MNINDYITVLQSTTLFKSFSKEALLELFSRIPYKISSYNRGDIIFSEDDECKTLNMLLDGKIEIQNIDQMGKVLSIAEFVKGEIFGEMLIFSDRNTYPINVLSKSATVVLHMQKDAVISLCQLNGTFLYEYLRTISNKAMLLNMKLSQITLKTIRQKICDYILTEHILQKSTSIHLPMTKKEWADKLGVQRPSLSRELIKLKEEELIDYDKNIITILDLEGLKEFI
jgi:CRP-like cAMP-binding protein